MLVYYIQHITNAIRIDTVMLGVRRSTMRALSNLYPNRVNHDSIAIVAPAPPDEAISIPIGRSGYVQKVDVDQLRTLASAAEATIRVRAEVGHHLVAGSAVGWAWARSGKDLETVASSDSTAERRLAVERELDVIVDAV